MLRLFEAFAGYGTSTFALKQLRIEHELVGFSEIDKYAVQCFQQNHGGKNFGDITKINWSEVPDFDLLTGGFPCQSFSVAGKGLGHLDERGILANYLTKALIEKQPKYFLFENVKGFMSKKHAEFRETLFNDWRNAGYAITYKVLNTKDFGVPQNRERVFIVGIRKDIKRFGDFVFPEPFELKLKLKDVLEEKVDEKYFLSENAMKRLVNNFQGFHSKLNPEIGSCLFAGQYKIARGMDIVKVADFRNDEGLRIRENGLQVRRLTPRECFRLQGFLDDRVNLDGLSDTQKYKLAGNGQSVNVVKLLFKELVKCMVN